MKEEGLYRLWHTNDYYYNMRRIPLTKTKLLASNVEVCIGDEKDIGR